MGKIYDALKRAEKEAQSTKSNQQGPAPEIIFNPKTLSETKGNATSHSSSNLQVRPKPVTQIKTTREKITTQKKILAEVNNSPPQKHGGFPILNIFKRKKDGIPHNSIGELYTLNDTHSIVSEQYRVLRARIMSFCKEKNMRTILVTSSLPGEGKSTVAANLSISIANSINEHALLVDCDLRRPSIHKIFNLNNGFGLSDYLSDDSSITQAFHKTLVHKLTIVTAGIPPGNPGELISSNKMLALTTELKNRYPDRFIIIDSTPACSTPEPSIMAKYIDCVIFVVKAGSTSREIIKQTIESLGENKIIGVVFNMAENHFKSYYSNNYYYSNQQ